MEKINIMLCLRHRIGVLMRRKIPVCYLKQYTNVPVKKNKFEISPWNNIGIRKFKCLMKYLVKQFLNNKI